MEQAMKFLIKMLCTELMSWLDYVVPPQKRAENISRWINTAQPYLTAAVVAVVTVKLFRRCIRAAPVKMMDALGRNVGLPTTDLEHRDIIAQEEKWVHVHTCGCVCSGVRHSRSIPRAVGSTYTGARVSGSQVYQDRMLRFGGELPDE